MRSGKAASPRAHYSPACVTGRGLHLPDSRKRLNCQPVKILARP